jgi:phage host-nuclease inhibitor protein Gam
MTYAADQLIQRYIEIRDEKAEIAERHKAELAPLNQSLEVLENTLMQLLNEQGGQNIKTAAGTAYRSEVMSVKVEDWDALWYYIQRFQRPDLLVRNVNKTAVKEIIDGGQALPPGISTQTLFNLNVRRA